MDNCLCQEEDEEGEEEEEEEEGRASKLKRVRKKKHRWLILSFSYLCFVIFAAIAALFCHFRKSECVENEDICCRLAVERQKERHLEELALTMLQLLERKEEENEEDEEGSLEDSRSDSGSSSETEESEDEEDEDDDESYQEDDNSSSDAGYDEGDYASGEYEILHQGRANSKRIVS